VQLNIKYYKNVVYSVVKITPIEDVGEITQHIILACISHQTKKNGSLAVINNDAPVAA
jgi:hypothetical protein